MSRRWREAGEGKIGCIFWTVLLVALVIAAWKMIPVKINSAELYDFMNEQAKFAGASPSDVLKKRIADKAAQLDLPVDREKQLIVEKSDGRIKMKCWYTVTVEFVPGLPTYEWEFNHEIDQPIFIW